MRIWRPPNTGVFTALPVLLIGGADGSIQTVCFAFHVPAICLANRAWASPGEEAFSQAAIIACCSGDMAGTWNAKQTVWMDPSAPPMTSTGKAVNTPVFGGRHIRMDYTGQFMGQPFEGVGYTGHDNVTGRYVSTWMDSMSTGAFRAEGEYDAATSSYTFRGEMADPMRDGAVTQVREVVRVVDSDRHVMEMYETHDGQERKTMEIEFTRVAD